MFMSTSSIDINLVDNDNHIVMTFKKRIKSASASASTSQPRNNLPAGVRISSQNAAPITSFGLAPIDAAIGGGLPLATLTILTEDFPSAYFRAFASYVIAQGLFHKHAVAVASFDTSTRHILQSLPAVRDVPENTNPVHVARAAVHDMKIAWRYQKYADPSTHIASRQSAPSLALDFDLSTNYSIPSNAPISCLDRDTFSLSLTVLLEQLEMHLSKAAEEKRLARIVVQGLSNAFISHKHDISINEFLSRLRGLCRVHRCVAVVTCARDVPLRIQAVASDALIQLDSFEGKGAGVAGLGKEWLGVLVIRKTYRQGCGPGVRGKGDVWVFKRGRRKYTMERATAAPDEAGEDDQTENTVVVDADQGQSSQKTGSGICTSKPQPAFEF